MYRHYIGYRFKNGEVMGFIGEGLSKQNAEINSHNKVIGKLKQLEESFNESQVLSGVEAISKLSIHEMKLIKSDWETAINKKPNYSNY